MRIGVGAFAFVAVLALAVVVGLWIVLPLLDPPPPPRTPGGIGAPLTMDQFKIGLGCVESDGDYEARNDRTDAFGKYQVLPVNWRVWAGRWVGDRRAEPTPENQELVATGKLRELSRAFAGNWARMAYWWLTGREEPDRTLWSAFANGYVDGVLGYARAAQTTQGRTQVPIPCFSTPEDPHPNAPPSMRPPSASDPQAS